jgi:proteic killer suppression protein
VVTVPLPYYALHVTLRVMIRSWKDKEAEALWLGELCRKFQAIHKQARIRLLYLHSAVQLKDLRLPGYRLEKLTGDRKGQYSIRINDQYRVLF